MIRATATATLAAVLLGVLSCTQAFSPQKPFAPAQGASNTSFSATRSETCKQVPAVFPVRHKALDSELEKLYNNKTFQRSAIDTLSALIQIPLVIALCEAGVGSG